MGEINQPEVQADGSVRYLNDITQSAADFVVSDQDYAGTLRQVMLEQMSAMAQKMPDRAWRCACSSARSSSATCPTRTTWPASCRRIIGDRDPTSR